MLNSNSIELELELEFKSILNKVEFKSIYSSLYCMHIKI